MASLDFELKLVRATEHLQELHGEVRRFIDEVMNSLTEEPDPNAPGYQLAWITANDPPHYPISVLIGDCLQCLRTSLDHLAFELASSFSSPLTDELAKDTEFPVLPDEDRRGNPRQGPHLWASTGAKKVRGIDPAAQKIIEGEQPYKAGAAYSSKPLWVLHELNRIDKHRLLHVVTMTLGGHIVPPRPRWQNIAAIEHGTFSTGRVHIEGRTLIARWPARAIDPNKEMRLNIRPQVDVVFGDSVPLVARRPVTPTLARLYNHIVRNVVPPLRHFLN